MPWHAGTIRCDVGTFGGNGLPAADGFLYARCVVVANGREFYEAVPLVNTYGQEKDFLLLPRA